MKIQHELEAVSSFSCLKVTAAVLEIIQIKMIHRVEEFKYLLSIRFIGGNVS